ncbi:MAG: cell division protein FtsW, partial [Gammaproteobacteria bacterium]|nr:cell division protein FtsW [Gammaproteobacteria bacterium]
MKIINESKRNAGTPSLLGVDGWLLFSAATLFCLGVVFVTSASITTAERDFGLAFYYTKKHLLFASLSLISAAMVFAIPL